MEINKNDPFQYFPNYFNKGSKVEKMPSKYNTDSNQKQDKLPIDRHIHICEMTR